MRICNICGITNEEKEFSSGRNRCKECTKKVDRERHRIKENMNRAAWIITIGPNECAICGYNKCFAALDFHHLDPDLKEERIPALMARFGPDHPRADEVRKEMAKCILVCANCHREIHYS